jgi:6-pyruvoyl-tetrahydropterin synthase
MRWVVHASCEFSATHALASYLGAPEDPHLHRWRVTIRAGTDALHAEGYAVDFVGLRTLLEEALASLEGSDLNAHPEIGVPSPTAERLAEVVVGWLREPVAGMGATLLSVTVWEGPENRVDLNLE